MEVEGCLTLFSAAVSLSVIKRVSVMAVFTVSIGFFVATVSVFGFPLHAAKK
jgi:hypothetical protein